MSGVGKVVRFNWPTFVLTFAIAVAGVVIGATWSRVIAALALLGLINVLAATYWVYDRSDLYRFTWLTQYAGGSQHVLRVHTGLDESGAKLAAMFPRAEHLACDVYDPRYATEPSIARARASRSGAGQALTATADHLPVSDGWADVTLGFLALHEVRDPAMRQKLFAELRRTVRHGGHVLIVEHLRNVANFAVYGPGALHFLSRGAWIEAQSAGFKLTAERHITPFVRLFVFEAA